MSEVTKEIKDNILYITIDNPETKNGLDWIGLHELADCYQYAEDHSEILVMVVQGNEKYFYTGGRVNPANEGEREKYAQAIERLTTLQDRNRIPMIAAIKGDCLKAGMGMVAGCDLAIAKKGVKFGFPEVRMGGSPMMVMAETIDVLPKKWAMEAYYSSWEYDAEDMLRIGFLNAVVSEEEFDRTIEKYLDIFRNTPARLIQTTRKAYDCMKNTAGMAEKRKIALQILQEDVLSPMTAENTEYNV